MFFIKPNVEKYVQKNDINGLIKASQYKGLSRDLSHIRVREDAFEALSNIKADRVFSYLSEQLNSEYSEILKNASKALGHYGDKRVVPDLIRLVSNKDCSSPCAAESLGDLADSGDPKAIDALIFFIVSSHQHESYKEAVIALANLGSSKTFSRFKNELRDWNVPDVVRAEILDILKDHTITGEAPEEKITVTCDICGIQSDFSSQTKVRSMTIKRAIHHGFNPFDGSIKFPTGFAMSELGVAMGVSPEEQYVQWKQSALNSNTDWLICSSCNSVLMKSRSVPS